MSPVVSEESEEEKELEKVPELSFSISSILGRRKVCRKSKIEKVEFSEEISEDAVREDLEEIPDSAISSPRDAIDHSEEEGSSEEDPSFKCRICDKDFQSEVGLRNHSKKKHKSSSKATKKHKEESPGEESSSENEESFKCRGCKNNFESEIQLKDHGRKKHFFQCSTCDSFSNKFCISRKQCLECYYTAKRCYECGKNFGS